MKKNALILLFAFYTFSSSAQIPTYQLKQVTADLEIPWGFDFLPSGDLIITERQGTMKHLDLSTKKLTPIKGVPQVKQEGQGGLLDVALHPTKFKTNQKIFLTYTDSYSGGVGTVLASATLKGNTLKEIKTLFKSQPPERGGRHFGSRIAFGSGGTLFFGVGDRGDRDNPQDLSKPQGKIFRIFEDGQIPKDNPFIHKKNSVSAIWSYGHRNPQGLARHPLTGELWEQEHGPRGGDEINLIQKGKNYGWPVITYGKEYYGPSIGPSHKEGMEQPVKQFTPSIAPSSLMIYSGKLFGEWKGHFFSAALKLRHLNRLEFKNGKPVREHRMFEGMRRRVRHVREAPNGEIFFSTDRGEIYRISKP